MKKKLLLVVMAILGLTAGIAGTNLLTASAATPTSNGFKSIDCVTDANCWSVGKNTAQKTLIDHWNGVSWAVVASPNGSDVTLDPSNSNSLNAVKCVSATDCWAAGFYSDSDTGTHELYTHWNGLKWSLVAGPVATSTDDQINALTCIATNDCWSVGFSSNNTLIEHYDGSTWSVVESPSNVGADNTALNGLHCLTTNDCWAVGISQWAVSPTTTAVILHWDGTSWILSDPGTNNVDSYGLNDVSCFDAIDCFAVGVNNSNHKGLIDAWDGTQWSPQEIDAPAIGGQANLQSITCPATNNCWTVGTYGATVNGEAALAQHFDGAVWDSVSTASPDTFDNFLSVICTSESSCWAAGVATQNDSDTTLVEHAALTLPASATVNAPNARLMDASLNPAASIGDASVVESDQVPGARTAYFPVTLNRPAIGPATLNYQLFSGTAIGTPTFTFVKTPDHRNVASYGDFNDYKGAVKTIKFNATSLTANSTVQVNIPVTVYGDTIPEADEQFTVVLFNPSTNIQVGRAQGTGTVIDNDS